MPRFFLGGCDGRNDAFGLLWCRMNHADLLHRKKKEKDAVFFRDYPSSTTILFYPCKKKRQKKPPNQSPRSQRGSHHILWAIGHAFQTHLGLAGKWHGHRWHVLRLPTVRGCLARGARNNSPWTVLKCRDCSEIRPRCPWIFFFSICFLELTKHGISRIELKNKSQKYDDRNNWIMIAKIIVILAKLVVIITIIMMIINKNHSQNICNNNIIVIAFVLSFCQLISGLTSPTSKK